jgi:3-hydroxybutyryl-CoA dehydrogenase
MTPTAAILGSGTMGAGIAQVAASHGWRVELLDVDRPTAQAALERIEGQLERLVQKGRLDAAARDQTLGRLHAGDPAALRGADLLIEAVVEDMAVKADVLRPLIAALPADAIVATNTSSLSVSALGAAVGCPRRVLGMHFFNPAPLMQLVEIVAGRESDPALVERAVDIATSWGKRVARAADVPGFIVNHVARPYYLEAFRVLEDGFAGVAEIDAAMRDAGGFRMGPFELTDLIGQDVNAATTRSVWEQLGRPPLLRPSPLQEDLVARGHLGRKSGRGAYDHAVDPPRPALEPARRSRPAGPALERAVADFAAAAGAAGADPLAQHVLARILVALIAQAHLARDRGVASEADIDLALRCGVNYPRGPFEWAARIGRDRCAALLAALDAVSADRRFDVRLN